MALTQTTDLPAHAPYVGPFQTTFLATDFGALTLSAFGSRSDAFDRNEMKVVDHLHDHVVIGYIKRFVMPYLARPVIVSTTKASRAYRDQSGCFPPPRLDLRVLVGAHRLDSRTRGRDRFFAPVGPRLLSWSPKGLNLSCGKHVVLPTNSALE